MPSLRSTGKMTGSSARQLAQQYHLPPPVSLRELIDKLGIHGEPDIPFVFGVHNLQFPNFSDGVPDLGTFKDTFGTAEILDELFDPIFGHPILTAAFYGFYHYYLEGTDKGGLATGFCTALASLVTDNFWTGRTDTYSTITKENKHSWLTAVHGKLLSQQSILHFHGQGAEGVARVERTCREVEATFLRGCTRKSAPMIFVIPSGSVWSSTYFDRLGKSHCVMPYRFQYPPGHPGPQLSQDGSTTVTDLNNVELYVWDCNFQDKQDCRFVFKNNGGQIDFEYYSGVPVNPEFTSQRDFTLGMRTNGDYLLGDHDLPFGGRLLGYILEFLLSPADLQVTNQNGQGTGNFGGQIRADIPGSHPCYLLPGAYLLPADAPLTRVITGTGPGRYTFNSLTPTGSSLVLEGVTTAAGQQDVLSMNPDQTQVNFAPAVEKTFDLTLARWVGDEARAITIQGVGGGPAAPISFDTSPELTSLNLKNGAVVSDVQVKIFALDRKSNTTVNKTLSAVTAQPGSTISIAVADWKTGNANLQTFRPQ